VIIGGGPAGLSSAVALRRRGIDSIVLDGGERVGDSWRQRYDGLHLHTHRRWSGLSHGRLPRSLPRYPSRDQYADWLEAYARSNELDVRLGTQVESVRRGDDDGWRVSSSAGVHRTRAVVVATGLYRQPVHAPTAAAGSRVTVVHASRFRSASRYDGTRALVVGVGNSGAEIAAELAADERWSVALSVRTPPPIRRRDIARVVPSQAMGIVLSALPASVAAGLDAAAARLGPDLTAHGLGPAGWEPFRVKRPPVIDAGLVEQVLAGRIEVVPALDQLTFAGASLVDGSEHTADLIVLATGYAPGLESLLPADVLRPDGRVTERAAELGLFAVGYVPTMRGQLYEIRVRSLQTARRVEQLLAGG
jgi:cation diffusion facilitator CzcD-associated flavoprotein CzcO